MTASKPVSALALGLSSAVAFGFGAAQASADVNQVVQHRLTSLQGDPTPSPVLALSAVLSKADAAALLKQLPAESQIKFAQILQRLPDLSKAEQTKLAALAKSDPAKAQVVIAAILAKMPNLPRPQATLSAALITALLSKSPALAKAGFSALPDLSKADEAQAQAAIEAFIAKLPDASASSLTKEDAAKILQAIQKTDLSKISGLADLDLSKPGQSGLDMAKTEELAEAIVAKQPDLSKESIVLVVNALAKLDLSKVSGAAKVDLSKVAGLSGLSQVQIDAIAGAIAEQAAQEPEQASALSQEDLATAQEALTKIDPASLPDLSKVDLAKLGAPPK